MSRLSIIRSFPMLGVATLVALAMGCFTDPASGPMTTGDDCDPGSFGCECLDDVCEPDLECTPSGVCIPEDCTPGMAVCECDARGQCGPGLECMANVCLPPSSSGTDTTLTGGVTTSMTASTTSSTTTSTTEADSSTTVMADSSSTAADTTADTGPSETTDAPMACAEERSCSACLSCTNEVECSAAFGTCQGIPNCLTAANCIDECAAGNCFNDCCEGESQAFRDAAEALHSCRVDTCILGPCPQPAAIPVGYCGS